MRISLSDTGKRFNRDWIFRKVSFVFHEGGSYAITGPNGSGKSTLLQVIAGAIAMSEGTIDYTISGKPQVHDQVFKKISLAAPYLELIEEMTLTEFLNFHQQFKPLIDGFTTQKIISVLGLEKAANKQIRYFSSGMKQRVKLAQAIFSDTPCLLLDEPCTNLDTDGIALYRNLVTNHCINRLLIVSSNDPIEYDFCKDGLNIMDYK
jgi:ABC-type multidrug transport system ATPase subunit